MASRADRNAYLSGLRTKLPLNPNYLTKMILDSVFHVNIHSFCAFLDVGGVIIKAGDMEYAINDVKRLNLTLIDSRWSITHIVLPYAHITHTRISWKALLQNIKPLLQKSALQK